MDKAAQLAGSANFGVFKEPRGFIRLLEFFLAIFAFATTTSHSSYSSFTVACPAPAKVETVELPFSYPFKLTETAKFPIPVCNHTGGDMSAPCCNYNNPAEFYVFVGVMAWLYTLGITVFYVLFDDRYRENENIPTADFIVTAIFSVLWLIASSAWADGLTHVKQYINPEELFEARVPDCSDVSIKCESTYPGNFGKLNVSIIFGFLCMFVWAGNCWFLYKETKWGPAKRDSMYREPEPVFGEEDIPK